MLQILLIVLFRILLIVLCQSSTDIKNPQSINFPLYNYNRGLQKPKNHAEPRASDTAVYAEALVMSTRFLKEHIEIKWWTDRYYHHRGSSVDSHSWHLNTKLVTVHL